MIFVLSFEPTRKENFMKEFDKIQMYKKACLNTSMVAPYYPATKAMTIVFAKYLCDIQTFPKTSQRRATTKKKLFELVDILDKYTTIERTTVSSLVETRHYINFKTFNVPETIQAKIRKEANEILDKENGKSK